MLQYPFQPLVAGEPLLSIVAREILRRTACYARIAVRGTIVGYNEHDSRLTAQSKIVAY